MREHEVPTHVQAEDRVLLWFTFPQVVAMTAVCALSYGAYRYAPLGPSEVRMAIAVLFGLAGIAAVVGKIGGRRLPLVAADLLKYRLGARLYAGPASELVRSEPPAPAQPVKSGPGPLSLMARRAGKTLRRLRPKRKARERKGGRMPFRPHRWFGKPRRTDKDNINGSDNGGKKSRRTKPPKSFLAAPWRDEIDFEVTEPVEGRRIFVEALTVSGDRAAVTLRAATALDIRVRAFGGPQGTWLWFWGSASLDEAERIDYSVPLHGPVPSLTVSWEDTLGQAGALTLKHDRIPYPLPEVEGELCDLRFTSLGWTRGAVGNGGRKPRRGKPPKSFLAVAAVVVLAAAVATIPQSALADDHEPWRDEIDFEVTVAGHESVTETALMDAGVTAITGTVVAATGASTPSVPFVPNGETRFRLSVPTGEAVHAVTVDVSLEASLGIPIPPLTQLTHHPERVEEVTRTVYLYRPGDSDYDSETVTAACEEGSTATATATAYAYVPSATVAREVTVSVVHPEHVKAETVERGPFTRSRQEHLSLASGVGTDDPFETLALPELEPEDPPAEQSPADGLRGWFDRLGWEWPW